MPWPTAGACSLNSVLRLNDAPDSIATHVPIDPVLASPRPASAYPPLQTELQRPRGRRLASSTEDPAPPGSRPDLRPADRLFLSALSRMLPRRRWASFMVTPHTLLRWHRQLVRRKWTYKKESNPGRRPLPSETVALIVRLAKENPRWRTCGSKVSCRNEGSRSAPPPSVGFLKPMGSGRPPEGADRAGLSSSKPKLTGSWPATSSPSRRFG